VLLQTFAAGLPGARPFDIEILPKTGALVAFAGAFFGIGVWCFRFE